MNIEDFFKSLDGLDNSIIQIDKYPKNVNYLTEYKTFDNIRKRNIPYDETNNNYMLYTKKDNKALYSIGIDSELNYIKTLDYSLILPIKNRIYLADAILEGIELFDRLIHIENNPYIKSNIKVNMKIIYLLFSSKFSQLDLFNQELLLEPFEQNPIKKDIFLAQFIYFIKKYLEYRLNNETSKKTRVSQNTFNINLSNSLKLYLENTQETLFYQVVIKKLINDLSSK